MPRMSLYRIHHDTMLFILGICVLITPIHLLSHIFILLRNVFYLAMTST
jgi:hypothetical protein